MWGWGTVSVMLEFKCSVLRSPYSQSSHKELDVQRLDMDLLGSTGRK